MTQFNWVTPGDGSTLTSFWSPAYWTNDLYKDKGTAFYFDGGNWQVGNWTAYPALSPLFNAWSDFQCQYLAGIVYDYFEAKCLNGSIIIYSGSEYWTSLDYYKTRFHPIQVDPPIHSTGGIILSLPTASVSKVSKIVTYVPTPSPPKPTPSPKPPAPTPSPSPAPITLNGSHPWDIYKNFTSNVNHTVISPGPPSNASFTPVATGSITYEIVIFYELFQNGSFQILYMNDTLIYYPLIASSTPSKFINWISPVNQTTLENFWSPIYSENLLF